MTILYAVIANSHSKAVLCEYSSTKGNFRTVTVTLLRKLGIDNEDGTGGKIQIQYDESFVFNCLCRNEVYYIVLCDESDKYRLPFAFLEDISSEFQRKYTADSIASSPAYGFDKEFGKTLKTKLEFYNSPQADNFVAVSSKLHEVKEVMSKNITEVLGRGEKLDLLVERTTALAESSDQFRKRSKALRDTLMWRRIKWYLFFIACAAIFLWLLTSFLCGFDYEQC